MNKTLVAELPKIPDGLIPHFLRGAIEGDGSVTKEGSYFRIYLCSASENFLLQIKDKIPFTCSWVTQTKNRLNPLHKIVFSGIHAAALAEWIYKDSDGMRMTRKYGRCLWGINSIERRN